MHIIPLGLVSTTSGRPPPPAGAAPDAPGTDCASPAEVVVRLSRQSAMRRREQCLRDDACIVIGKSLGLWGTEALFVGWAPVNDRILVRGRLGGSGGSLGVVARAANCRCAHNPVRVCLLVRACSWWVGEM